MKLNTLGLDKAKVEKEIGLLNVLLANYQTYYQNLRGVHWNVKGKRFFELHVKFKEAFPFDVPVYTAQVLVIRLIVGKQNI